MKNPRPMLSSTPFHMALSLIYLPNLSTHHLLPLILQNNILTYLLTGPPNPSPHYIGLNSHNFIHNVSASPNTLPSPRYWSYQLTLHEGISCPTFLLLCIRKLPNYFVHSHTRSSPFLSSSHTIWILPYVSKSPINPSLNWQPTNNAYMFSPHRSSHLHLPLPWCLFHW